MANVNINQEDKGMVNVNIHLVNMWDCCTVLYNSACILMSLIFFLFCTDWRGTIDTEYDGLTGFAKYLTLF